MRQLGLTLAAVAIIFSACGNQKKEGKKNTDIINSAAKSRSSASSEKLTKAMFIQKVWDYTKSPDDFKYLGSKPAIICLLYTSDAADEEDSVDLGGRRIIKK